MEIDTESFNKDVHHILNEVLGYLSEKEHVWPQSVMAVMEVFIFGIKSMMKTTTLEEADKLKLSAHQILAAAAAHLQEYYQKLEKEKTDEGK